MAELNEAYRLLGRGGEPPEPAPGEPASGEPAWPADIDDPLRGDGAVGSGMSRRGLALVVLAGLCALAVVVVFVAAVGYDWSVGTR